jgi:hypothetical protein
MCEFIAKIMPEIISGFIATLLAAAVAAMYVAHIKAERLRLEFCELAEILKGIHDARSDNESYKITEQRFEALKIQIKEIMEELTAAREGVFSVPITFKKRLRVLENEVEDIVVGREAKDFIKTLYGNSDVEIEFRQSILDLSKRAKVLGEELSFHTLLFP